MYRRTAALLFLGLCGTAIATSEAAEPTERPDQELMLLAVLLDGEVVEETLSCYISSEGLLVPLGELSRILGLAIMVRPKDGVAEGWAISEGRTFLLHASARVGSFDDKPINFLDSDVWVRDDDLFVDSRLLERLLPLTLRVDLRAAVLEVIPREKLPLQIRRERERAMAAAMRGAGYEPHYPRVELPYRAFVAPSVDQNVTVGVVGRRDANPAADVRYSTLATGELLYLQTDLFVAGTNVGIPDARVHAGRKDIDGNLLGPLHATSFSIGDVGQPGVDLVSMPRTGPGFQLTNRPLRNPTHFDRHTFRGELRPGWDVELYRNGVLVGYQTARGDGRYEFEGVPLLFGLNAFRLVFHGPEGQRREEREVFNVGEALVPAGKMQYRLTANLPAPALRLVSLDERRTALELDYGLGKNVSTALTLATVGRDGRDLGYAKASVHGFWKWLSASADVAGESNGGFAAQGVLRGQAGWVRATAKHAQLWSYESEQFGGGEILRGRSSVGSDVSLPIASTVSLASAELRRDWLLAGGDRTELFFSVGSRIGRFGLSQNLRWPLSGFGPASPLANAMATVELGRFALRGTADYRLNPGMPIAASLMAESRGLSGYSLSGGVGWQLNDFRALAAIGRTEGIFGLSLNGMYSTLTGATVLLAMSVAFKHDERDRGWSVQARNAASTGAASARVFIDKNLNGVMDGADEPLPNVQLALNGSSGMVRTNADGVAVFTSLQPWTRTDIGVVERTLEDPYLRPASEGFQLVARPGRMATLEFPMLMTGEVTGTVYAAREGAKSELPGVELELASPNGTRLTTRTAFDGFYTLPNLPPGKYLLRVSPEQLAAKGLPATPPKEIEIGPDGTVLDGFDIIVGEVKAPVLAEGPLRLPLDSSKPFVIDTPDGPLKVRYTRVVRMPLASWAAGLPLSEEEMTGIDQMGAAMAESPRNRLLIISHAQTVGAAEGALKRAKKGAELLRRYLKAVQFVPSKRVTISVIPQEPQSEPLGYIELVLVEPAETATGTGATAMLGFGGMARVN